MKINCIFCQKKLFIGKVIEPKVATTFSYNCTNCNAKYHYNCGYNIFVKLVKITYDYDKNIKVLINFNLQDIHPEKFYVKIFTEQEENLDGCIIIKPHYFFNGLFNKKEFCLSWIKKILIESLLK